MKLGNTIKENYYYVTSVLVGLCGVAVSICGVSRVQILSYTIFEITVKNTQNGIYNRLTTSTLHWFVEDTC